MSYIDADLARKSHVLPLLATPAVSGSFLTPAFGQLPTGYVDPAPVLRAVNEAMGVDRLRCITFSGVGYAGRVGQNVLQSTDWPPGEPLADYSRTINYEARTYLTDAIPWIRQAWGRMIGQQSMWR